MITIHTGDCRDVLAGLPAESVDACVTDPPYGLGFMGNGWDRGVPGVEFWQAVFRVLKPGAHLLAFSGTRTQHRMVCAIEDAGFEIRDQIGWAYGSGFPKSMDVSKAIDKAAGAEREVVGFNADAIAKQNKRATNTTQCPKSDPASVGIITAPATPASAAWQGWGTALKPAWEPICVARKPLDGTVAANVLQHGTGALNIDGCRVETHDTLHMGRTGLASEKFFTRGVAPEIDKVQHDLGRWPANLVHDGSDEVLACFPESKGQQSAFSGNCPSGTFSKVSSGRLTRQAFAFRGDAGSAARFFYCAKASRSERGAGNDHPTVKPVDLMRWLVRLVTPPGGVVLDPFSGSGSTGIAASIEQFHAILIEQDPKHAALARERIKAEAGLFVSVAAE